MNYSVISDDLKRHIRENIVFPSIENDIVYIIKNRTFWSRISMVCLTLSVFFISCSAVLSFLAIKFSNNLNIGAGLCSIFSILCDRFSNYANLRDHIETIEVNNILNNLNIGINLLDTSKISYQAIQQMENKENKI